MKLVVLGATGRTGALLVQQALDEGHDVVAVVRNPSKMKIKHDSLKVVEANVLSSESLQSCFSGQDAVLSCLGTPPKLFSQITFYQETMKAIIAAMRESDVYRLVCVTAWCTVSDPKDPGPAAIEKFVKPLFLKKALASMEIMERYLFGECNDISVTVVRPGRLTNERRSESDFKVEERQFVKGGVGQVPRANLAKFMLLTLTTDEYNGKGVAIDMTKPPKK